MRFNLLILILLPVLASSCFTGVESTPKIIYKEEKNSRADSSAEERISSMFKPDPFSRWESGKAFYVTSPRISLALSGTSPQTVMPETGDSIVYTGCRTVTDLTGDEIVELMFTAPRTGSELTYRTNSTRRKLEESDKVEIPFTIDLGLVGLAAGELAGKEYFIKTSLWSDGSGGTVNGRKFIKVKVTGVVPGNEVYPFRVLFADEAGNPGSVYMSAASGARWIPREFQSLFSIADPRLSYPQISDAMWRKIINSKVEKGMTKTEATLALGSPAGIDRGHDHSSSYERWAYSDGVYLIFEDGLLVRHNQ